MNRHEILKDTVCFFLTAAIAAGFAACGSPSSAVSSEATADSATAVSEAATSNSGSASSSASSQISLDENKAKADVISGVTEDTSLHDMLPDSIKKSGVIKNGLDDTYPPMSYRTSDNTLVGFDVDYGNAVAKKLGVKIDWIPTKFDGIITSLQSGNFDIGLSAFAITDDRKKVVNFNEYLYGGAVVVVKSSDADSVKSLDDLKGKTVGVQLGSSSETTMKKQSGVTLQTYDTIPQEFMDLQNGRIYAVVEGIQMAQYYSSLMQGIKLVYRINSYPWGIAFPKSQDGAKTQAAFKAAQTALNKDGTFDKISQKWFGSNYNDGKLSFAD